ncbi:MAG TPA: A/G-specific adenine glycosylase [Trueperaceae bacterium]|nr:A/G-specific adenine glycosylase [Trueperaceae bacterium]
MPSTVHRNDALLAWYSEHGRALPWRGETDPWRVLVVEVMSQQTQVSRVEERFGPFLERFPTPSDLAGARPEEAVRLWAGLGYLRRLVNLRRAAAVISEDGWPEDLTDLPGVGAYTAAAVACFARGVAVPTIDTNHRRVLSRWVGRALDGADLMAQASAALDGEQPQQWNQAVMDLGATVCRPTPTCSSCPVAAWCEDPTVYVPPARQSRFAGSLRQTRAAIVRALADGPATTGSLADSHGARVGPALEALSREAIVIETADGWRLA